MITNSGTDKIGTFNSVLNIIKILIFFMIICVALSNFELSNITPIIPEEQGFEGVLQASNILFFTYMGFDFISTLAEESINPKRDVPRAMVISIVAITFIYSLLAFAVTGMGQIGKEETALVQIF